ncbi:unnamed protein product, partial [Sphagnum troendelagicum]
MSRHPEILWAQRSDKVFITVSLPDAKNPQVKLEPDGRFTFSATEGSGNQEYIADLELFGKLNVDASKIATGLRHTVCELEKAEKGWWKRLLKAEGKAPPYVKADWDKWVDEDEEEDAAAAAAAARPMSDFDMGGMGGMGSMGGLGGDMAGLDSMSGMGGMDFSGFNAGGEDESDDDGEFSESKAAAEMAGQSPYLDIVICLCLSHSAIGSHTDGGDPLCPSI